MLPNNKDYFNSLHKWNSAWSLVLVEQLHSTKLCWIAHYLLGAFLLLRREHPMRWTKWILHMDELFHSCSRNILLHILLQQLASAALRDEVLNQESHQPVPVPSSQSSADCIGKCTDTNSFSAFCISLTIICNFHLRCWLPKHSKYFMA